MQKRQRLVDLYAFPGFRPRAGVLGVFGDPSARLVFLERRGKKPGVGYVAGDLEVFNGDIGRIEAVDDTDRTVSVRFDGRLVIYEAADLDELVLAYACSIHKAQGSEYPCVVLPVHTQHYVMLQRNSLYTGVTGGRRLVVLIGTRRALAIPVKNDRIESRFTQLASHLCSWCRGVVQPRTGCGA